MASWQVETWPNEENEFSGSLDADGPDGMENVWSSTAQDRSDSNGWNESPQPQSLEGVSASEYSTLQGSRERTSPEPRPAEPKIKHEAEELPEIPSQLLPDSITKELASFKEASSNCLYKKTKLLLDSSPGSRKAYNNLMMNTSKRPSVTAVRHRASEIAAEWRFWRPKRRRHVMSMQGLTIKSDTAPSVAFPSEFLPQAEPSQKASDPESLKNVSKVQNVHLEGTSAAPLEPAVEAAVEATAATVPLGPLYPTVPVQKPSIGEPSKEVESPGTTVPKMDFDFGSLSIASNPPKQTTVGSQAHANMYFEPLIPASRSESPANGTFSSF